MDPEARRMCSNENQLENLISSIDSDREKGNCLEESNGCAKMVDLH